jgi:trehalose/maltose hydrolase-like predicted phosphorylase
MTGCVESETLLPSTEPAPGWSVTIPTDGLFERVHEALLTVADGRVGTRGAREENGSGSHPLVLTAGLYESRDDVERLLSAPVWTGLAIEGLPDERDVDRSDWRVLDLRRGLLVRHIVTEGGPVHIVRLSSLARPGIVALRAEGPADQLQAGEPLRPPDGAEIVRTGAGGMACWMSVPSNLGGGVTASAGQEVSLAAHRIRVERIASYISDPDVLPSPDEAAHELRDARRVGFEGLLAENAFAWQSRWQDADVVIDGDDELQQSVRFGLFHLMSSVASERQAAVGARGMSGPAYAGHVFWDADVYVLPFLAATHPQSARAMLAYRVARLAGAEAGARERRLRGALFPWESASSGREVAPRLVRRDVGGVEPIRTGDHEEHIVADIAWAALEYVTWTGDHAFLADEGRRLLCETARFWASRARRDDRAHVYNVIGPDEYHDVVDDNAYTNVMARWNLRTAAAFERSYGAHSQEAEGWDALADELVDGYDPTTGLYEQCAGFFGLEPLMIGEMAAIPVAADLLLGRERVRATQVVKQPDVLMLHHLVPHEVAADSLEPNLDFYLPRTAHGSSLSPAICASLLARAGRPEEALELLRIACRIDLDDLTGTTSGGLHLAAMGGVWQALVYGFAGLRARPGALELDPVLPARWNRLEVRVQHQGVRVRVSMGHANIEVTTDGDLALRVAGAGSHRVDRSGARFDLRNGQWERRTS